MRFLTFTICLLVFSFTLMAQHHPFLLKDSFILEEIFHNDNAVLILRRGESIKYNNDNLPIEIFNLDGSLLNTFEYAEDWKRENNFRIKDSNGGPGRIIEEEFENGKLLKRISSFFRDGKWRSEKQEFYYNMKGLLTEIRSYLKVEDVYEIDEIETFSYNSDGRLISQCRKEIENGQSLSFSKNNFRFDVSGKLEYSERFLFLTSGDSILTDFRYLEYYSDGTLKSTYEISNFLKDSLQHYHFYDNGALGINRQEIYQIQDGIEFLRFEIDTFIGSGQFSNLPDSILKYEYEIGNQDPVRFEKLTNEYVLLPDSIVFFNQVVSKFNTNDPFPSYELNTREWLHYKKETPKKRDHFEGQVILFPNPVKRQNQICISGEGINFEGFNLMVYDELGKLVKTGILKKDSSFNAPNNSGAYFLKIFLNEREINFTRPFIVY